MITTDYSAEQEEKFYFSLLVNSYNDALEKIDTLNTVVSVLLATLREHGIPIPKELQEQLELDDPLML